MPFNRPSFVKKLSHVSSSGLSGFKLPEHAGARHGAPPLPSRYVFSFGLHDVVDVAPRYAADWSAMRERRTWVPEGWLSLTLATINATRQAGLPAEAKATLAQRAAAEAEQLAELQLSVEARDATAAAKAAARAASAGLLLGDREAEARGRQTGSLKWRAARGELGPRSE